MILRRNLSAAVAAGQPVTLEEYRVWNETATRPLTDSPLGDTSQPRRDIDARASAAHTPVEGPPVRRRRKRAAVPETSRDVSTHLVGRPVSNHTYKKYGCRCSDCRAARAAARAAWQQRTKGAGPWCGTPGGYVNHGCRCDRCRAAHAAGSAHQRARNRGDA